MTIKDFVSWIEGYYGKYPVGQQADILDYLKQFSWEYLTALKKVCKIRISSQYGKPPDIQALESIKREVRDKIPRPLMIEERVDENAQDFKMLAKADGIDVSRPGWMARYAFSLVEKKKKEEKEEKEHGSHE